MGVSTEELKRELARRRAGQPSDDSVDPIVEPVVQTEPSQVGTNPTRGQRGRSARERSQPLSAIFEPPPPSERLEQGFSERLGARLMERRKLAFEIFDASRNGEQTYGESLLQLAGVVGAGAVLDSIGEGVTSAFRLTPDVIENPLRNAASWAAHAFLETEVGKAGLEALESGVTAWEDFEAKNPRAARNIASVVDIAWLLAPVRHKPVASPPTAIGRVAQQATTRATRQVARRHADYVRDLVRRVPSKKTRIQEARRSVEVGRGPFRRTVTPLAPDEHASAAAVRSVPGISSRNTFQGNLNLINREITRESKALEAALINNPVVFPRRELNSALNRAINNIRTNRFLVGDGKKRAIEAASEMIDIAAKHPSTGIGLLRARRAFDRAVERARPRLYDAEADNALSVAVKEVRSAANNLLISRAPNVAVQESLRRQTNLLFAGGSRGTVTAKAAMEANNAFMRTWKNILSVLPFRGEFNQSMAFIFGVGGLGASARFAPIFTSLVSLGVVSYVGGRMVIAPSVKRGISAMLREADKIIGRGTADPALVRQLRTDRAALLEILRHAAVVEPQQDDDSQAESSRRGRNRTRNNSNGL